MLLLCLAMIAFPADQPVSFSRDVLPILSNKCFVCHGPDGTEKDTLRLDSYEAAAADRGGYQVIDSSAPEKSELLARIHSADDPMPPRDAGKQLTEREREVLSLWIRQGGSYAKHWAFVPPVKALRLDGVDGEHVIDRLIDEQLTEHGITFAPEADRATLARRAALVLTGLPPEPELLAEFLNDPRDTAYETLIDQLLASSRFGEHQARYWLDAVRYGDTHGLHLDNRRGIYPYRDWVVYALNQNLPLDEFITWQLAGDLLPAATLAQQVATGFVRMNPTTSEGGAIPAEFQAKNNFDRTETLGTVLLGMTLTCARCHTHKFDPIPQTEYYRLLAFFNSTAENSMDGNSYTYGPTVKAPQSQADWHEWASIEQERQRLLAAVQQHLSSPERIAAFVADAEARTRETLDDWRIAAPTRLDAAAPAGDQWQPVEGLPGKLKKTLPGVEQAMWLSVRLDVPVDQTLWMSHSGGANSSVWMDDVPVGGDRTKPLGATRVALTVPVGTHEIRVKMAGSMGKVPISVNFENPWRTLAKTKRWADCETRDQLDMLGDEAGSLSVLDVAHEARELVHRIDSLHNRFTTSLVARDLESPRTTQRLLRGEYHLPEGEALEPGVLTVMGEFPPDAPRNRLGLAQWLTSRDHPLVARVLVNRIWQRTFGEGLVRTPEDFGLQGQQPTHPELLDWLAVELQESGWDLKHMLRLMVTSRTFRQHSARRAEIDDPENRRRARGPRHRLDAEVIRDIALWASGLLDTHQGGEGVKPYQPDGMWLAMAHPASNTKRYERDRGTLLYRRSLYVYWKRTSPHPMMTLFDAPDRESSCVRRSRTSTPLQSLGLLNETQRIEMSRKLAERLVREGASDAQRLDLLFGWLACREPRPTERAACLQLLASMRSRYRATGSDAEALLSIGDAERDASLPAAEVAAWSQVATTVLASDVALMLY